MIRNDLSHLTNCNRFSTKHSGILYAAVRAALRSPVRGRWGASLVLAALVGASGANAQLFPAQFELSTLLESNGGDGTEGFVLPGSHRLEDAGFSVGTARDINHDGIDDFLVSEPGYFACYIVYGTSDGYPAEIQLSSLLAENGGDGSIGAVLRTQGLAGCEPLVPATDANGDGLDDYVLGGNSTVFLLYGKSEGFPVEFEVESLFQANGGEDLVGDDRIVFTLEDNVNGDVLRINVPGGEGGVPIVGTCNPQVVDVGIHTVNIDDGNYLVSD